MDIQMLYTLIMHDVKYNSDVEFQITLEDIESGSSEDHLTILCHRTADYIHLVEGILLGQAEDQGVEENVVVVHHKE